MMNRMINDGGDHYWYNQEWQLHRTDGPAIACTDGTQLWYVNGERKIKNSSFQKATSLTDKEMTLIILKYGNIE